MQMYKPKFKENDLEATESINRQFLNSFSEYDKERQPKKAKETCDMHLSGAQPVLYITPKKIGTEAITWQEPKDIAAAWGDHINAYWGIVAFAAFIFILFIFYFWGF